MIQMLSENDELPIIPQNQLERNLLVAASIAIFGVISAATHGVLQWKVIALIFIISIVVYLALSFGN